MTEKKELRKVVDNQQKYRPASPDCQKQSTFKDNKNHKRSLIIVLVVAVACFFAGTQYNEYLTGSKSAEATIAENSADGILTEVSTEQAGEMIVIHIKGEVEEPGILSLPLGSRLADAIEKVSLTSNADLDAVNLSRIINDQDEVYIPSRVFDDNAGASSDAAKHNLSENTKIDINSAGAEELQKLSGIGESMSARIIDWREDVGRFNSIEDLKNVSGIGDKIFEKIKGEIVVY
ncbi:MAG: helix-hairpin-helix domain-containing protein [Bacillota bacterium]